MKSSKLKSNKMNLVSLFAGIGGFELAFKKIARTTLMCEIDEIAKYVLQKQLPSIPIINDIRDIEKLPDNTDILCAGFPCQDLSSVGIKKGLSGTRSSLVWEVFRLLESNKPEWVILENVSFMLSLNNGEAIRVITSEFERLGYKWAYRTIDSISFVPQHRARVFVVASLNSDPRNVILSGSCDSPIGKVNYNRFQYPLGFYWTEGRSALGLVENAIPTLKAGSTIGIPSPPAIVFPNGEVSTPDICDAELLQGFPENWTKVAEDIAKPSARWKLVGNAVTVNTVKWIADKIINPELYDATSDTPVVNGSKWPKAAWSMGNGVYESKVSLYPQKRKSDLISFLKHERKSLSLKASEGFLKRLHEGRLKHPEHFEFAIENHIKAYK